MRFADEVVPPDELEDVLPEERAEGRRSSEIEMAEQLIESLTTDFDPSSTATSTARSCWR